MEYEAQVYLLSAQFMKDYPNNLYPELMYKTGRPYACLLIDSHDGFFICVPFRSFISHNNAYLFQNTARSRNTKSGLDYSKIVIINNSDYIDSTKTAVVDRDEYHEMMVNLPHIIHEVLMYVDTYIKHVNGSSPLHPRQFMRKYGFTTLKYFHNILQLNTF